MTARQIIEARLGRALGPIAQRIADAGIEVKPLEWVEDAKGGFVAEGFNGTYRIRQSVSGTWAWQTRHMGIWAAVESRKAAKAAAQADYDARILSALQEVKP